MNGQSMKILLWSDVHCHTHQAFARYTDGINSRLLDGLRVIDQVTEIAKDCDLAIFLGDLFHMSPPPAVVFNEVYDRMCRLAETCQLLMIAGNHDLKSQYYNGDPRDIPFLKFLEFGRSSGSPQIFEVGFDNTFHMTGAGCVSLFGFHHRRPEDAAKLIKKARPHDILVMHQEVYGATNGAGHVFRGGPGAADLLKKFRWVFTGHIHRPQVLDERVVCVGAGMHINFGDEGDRLAFVLDTEKDDLTDVALKFPRFVTLAPNAELPDDENFYRPAPLDTKKREALRIPGCGEAIESYCEQQKHPEYVEVGQKIVSAVPQEVVQPQPFVLKHVEIENFGVFAHAKYDVDDGLHLVVGEIGDSGRSNGSGKSTIGEAVSFALYGLTSKGVKGEDVIRRPRKRGKACSVTLRFDSPLGELEVTRKQTASGSKLEARLGDHIEAGRVPDVQKWLSDTLGVGYEFFRQMVYFSQEKAEFFAQMNDASRKRVLGTLLGLSWYEGAEAAAKEKLGVAKEMEAGRETKVRELVVRREEKQREQSSLRDQSARWSADRDLRVTGLEEQLQKANAEWVEISEGFDAMKDLHEENKTRELAEAVAGLKKALERLETEEHEEREKFEAFHRQRVQELVAECAEVESFLSTHTDPDIGLLEKSLDEAVAAEQVCTTRAINLDAEQMSKGKECKQLERECKSVRDLVPGTRCPTCHAPITIDSRDSCLAETEAKHHAAMDEYAQLSVQAKEARTSLDVARSAVASVKDLLKKGREIELELINARSNEESLNQRLDNLNAKRDTFAAELKERFSKERREVEVDDRTLKDRIEKRYAEEWAKIEKQRARDEAAVEAKVGSLKDGIKRLREEKDPYESRYKDLLVEIASVGEELGLLEKKRDEAKAKVAAFEFWARGFGREGIRAALLHGFCDAFTAEVNDILQPMGVGLSAQLSPAKTLKSGEVRDQLEYVIGTPVGTLAYNQLSGGEKTRVDLASMLALNRIASRHFGIEDGLFGVLFLDEVFSSLDDEGCEVTHQVLQGFTARSVYVISHNQSMKSLFDKVLTVRRSGNSSELVA